MPEVMGAKYSTGGNNEALNGCIIEALFDLAWLHYNEAKIPDNNPTVMIMRHFLFVREARENFLIKRDKESGFYSLLELQKKPYPIGIDTTRREV